MDSKDICQRCEELSVLPSKDCLVCLDSNCIESCCACSHALSSCSSDKDGLSSCPLVPHTSIQEVPNGIERIWQLYTFLFHLFVWIIVAIDHVFVAIDQAPFYVPLLMSTHSNHSGLQEGASYIAWAKSWLNNPLLSLLLEQLKHSWIVWSLIAMQTLSSLPVFTFLCKDCQPWSSPSSAGIIATLVLANFVFHLLPERLPSTSVFTSLCRDCQPLLFTFCRDLVSRKKFWCLHSPSSAEILHLRKQIWFCDSLQIWPMIR